MDDGELALIQELLSSELGRGAHFRLYDRGNRTPMNFVLDEVERQLGPNFLVYWVDGGGPEVFCLSGFSKTPVVFSTSYLELSAFARDVIVQPLEGALRATIAEETALNVIAELALRHGDPDLAVLAFAKAEADRGIYLQQHDRLMAYEHAPIDESYMAMWFYGLVHELGHAWPRRVEPNAHGPYSDQGIAGAVGIALERFPYPESLRAEILENARLRPADSLLGTDHLREEGMADLFAVSVLFQATLDIMREVGGEPFRIQRFFQEMVIFLIIVYFLDRCARVARSASARSSDRQRALDMGMAPVAFQVRAMMQRVYLDHAAAVYVYGNEPTEEQTATVQKSFDAITGSFKESVAAIETGLARAMEFGLWTERRPDAQTLLEAFRVKSSSPGGEMAVAKARRFCESAEALGREGELLNALRRITENPGAPVFAARGGDLLFYVPWVHRQDGVEYPLGLDTKYGHLIFVFQSQGERFRSFFEASNGLLPEGLQLKTAGVVVPHREVLGQTLAARMPAGLRFAIAVEGSEEFDRFMHELDAQTIWPEE